MALKSHESALKTCSKALKVAESMALSRSATTAGDDVFDAKRRPVGMPELGQTPEKACANLAQVRH